MANTLHIYGMRKNNTNTTKLCCINNDTGQVIILNNQGVASRYFGIKRHTIAGWFREGNSTNLLLGGDNYTIYKADKFIIR